VQIVEYNSKFKVAKIKIYGNDMSKNLIASVIMIFAATMTQAKTIECITKVEVGENFETQAKLFARDEGDTNRLVSVFDLKNLTITNADTKAKVSVRKIAEDVYESKGSQFMWRYLVNPERTLVIETSMTRDVVYVKILKCK
jgi:hypothetical protein